MLCDAEQLNRITELRSVREAALATDHYLVRCVTTWGAQAGNDAPNRIVQNLEALRTDVPTQKEFVKVFANGVRAVETNQQPDLAWEATKKALREAENTLPQVEIKRNRPWISDFTMNLIDKRAAARRLNESEEERRLHREIKIWADGENARRWNLAPN